MKAPIIYFALLFPLVTALPVFAAPSLEAPAVAPGGSDAPGATKVRLDVNDVAWLFPRPSNANDLRNLISMETLKSDDGAQLWPQAAFDGLMAIADSGAAQVQEGERITLPPEVRQMSAWKVAGIRFDGSAPGGATEVIEKFGSNPQIRLILQPVTANGTKVHDIAVHLIFNFSDSQDGGPGNFAKAVPDEAAFKEVVNALLHVKEVSASLGAPTSGQLMGVHPGLANKSAAGAVEAEMRKLLTTQLPKGKFRAMAIIGLPNGFEPWVFVAIVPTPAGGFAPAPGFNMPSPASTAQGISFSVNPGVSPSPATNNRNPITGQVIVPLDKRRGVSTSVLFGAPALGEKAVIGRGSDGAPILDAEATNGDIPDIVGNPKLAHFFNTDCVSCHTETTRAKALGIAQGKFAFKPAAGISGLSDAVKPTGKWTLRNFGWGPSGFEPKPVVTQRAYNEIADVAVFINGHYLK